MAGGERVRIICTFALAGAVLAADDVRIHLPAKQAKLGEGDVKALVDFVSDPVSPVEKRVAAIGYLALARAPEAVEPLSKLLLDDRTVQIKVASAWALGRIGDPRGLSALLVAREKILQDDPLFLYTGTVEFEDAGERKTFLQLVEDGIGELGSLVVKELAEAVKIRAVSDSSPGSAAAPPLPEVGMARAALGALTLIGDNDYRAVDAMIQVLEAPDTRYPTDFKLMAARGLGRVLQSRREAFGLLEDKDQIRDRMSEKIVKAMIEVALATEIRMLPQVVAEELSRSRQGYASAYLLGELSGADTAEKRERVVEMIGLVGDSKAAGFLLPLARAAKGHELSVYVRALGRLKDPASQKFIEQMTNSELPEVRSAAARSLGDLGRSRSIPLLAKLLLDPDTDVKESAANALGHLGAEDAVPVLVAKFDDPEERVRLAAVFAVGRINCKSALKAYLDHHLHPDPKVRAIIYAMLAKLGSAKSYRAVIDGLGDSDKAIASLCNATIQKAAMAKDNRRLAAALEEAVADPQCAVRAKALRFLKAYLEKRHISLLEKLTDEKDPKLRQEAAGGLLTIGRKYPKALKHLAKYAADPDAIMRSYAETARSLLESKEK